MYRPWISRTIKPVLPALILLAPSTALAGATLLNNLGGAWGYGTAVAKTDDATSGPYSLTTVFANGLRFGSSVRTQYYINANGNISFNTGFTTYTPSALPSTSRTMLAAFFADVDTRGATLTNGQNNIYYLADTIVPRLVVTNYNVGYYSNHVDRINAFQTIVTDRSDVAVGDFDVEYRYNLCQWTTGDASGGSGGFGGTEALMGIDTADGVHYWQHPASLDPSILDLCTTSNVNDPGVWRFQVRSGYPIVCGNGIVDAGEQCDDGDFTNNDGCTACVSYVDADYDGYYTDLDCDDTHSSVHPDATEICDGLDNDCDGSADEAGASGETTWYPDADGDGYGAPSGSVSACAAPTGYSAHATDCNDADAAISPAAIEYCNSVDDNCNGSIDEFSALDARTWYRDADNDGYGNTSNTQVACNAPNGYIIDDTDCDDLDATIHPNGVEICNGLDDDCDGQYDEQALGTVTWYRDVDGDGFGNPADSILACPTPAGYVTDNTDCDDANSRIWPGAAEICNGNDDDCDGLIDETGSAGERTWYRDSDNDGFGSPDSLVACYQPTGYGIDDTDCDDTDALVFPGAPEVCNGVDDNCDGIVDTGAVDEATWYVDSDGDGFGDAGTSQVDCTAPTGYVGDRTDCDDASALVNPSAIESCNGVDDDCDMAIDEAGATGEITWYADADLDGFGDPTTAVTSCTAPSDFISTGGDCDDVDALVNPAATESCNGVDDDCDGQVDESGATGELTWYQDADGDGFGDLATPLLSCDAPLGFVADATDCDDTDVTIFPGASEIWYDGIDQDCDGWSDFDADEDGHDSVDHGGDDCDDSDSLVNPDSEEIWYDGIDQNCDGLSDYDEDGDGFESTTYGGTDCDDADATVWPGAPDIPYDGIINDCNLVSDYDADQDGYNSAAFGGDDCDDANSSVNPGAAEIWYDGIDENCDGASDFDADGDGFESAKFGGTDCDDGNADVNPEAIEIWYDGVDQNCDSNDQDQDGDGWSLNDDCDDTDAKVFPGAPGWTKDCEPVDTGETGNPDTDDTSNPDTDDTGNPDTDDTDLIDSGLPLDSGILGEQLKGGGGCGCEATPARMTLGAWLLGLAALAVGRSRRHRSST